MRISQRSWLLINIMNVKNFTHELNYRLCFVEGSGRNQTWGMAGWGGEGCQILLLKEVTCRLKPELVIEKAS